MIPYQHLTGRVKQNFIFQFPSLLCPFILNISVFTYSILFGLSVKAGGTLFITNYQPDSTFFPHSESRFAAGDKTNNYVNADGLSVQYPTQWEKDHRSENDLLLYLRTYDKNAPHIFRELFTVTSEGIVNLQQSVDAYAEMVLSLNVDVWSRYSVDFIVEEQESFVLNGLNAIRAKAILPRLDQTHLFVFFIYGSKAYTIEYTATDITYNDFLEMVWKAINSMSIIQK